MKLPIKLSELIMLLILFIYCNNSLQAQDKPIIVTHAMGLLASPGNSMEAFKLNVANNLNVDIDLRPSKDGELILAHDVVSNRNYWGDLENSQVAMRDGFNKEQFKDATYKRFDDMLNYITEHNVNMLLHIELKDHTPELTQLALNKIYSHNLMNKCALWVLNMDEVEMVKKLEYGNNIKIYVWCDVYPDRIFKAITPENRMKIDGIGLYFKLDYNKTGYTAKNMLDTIHSAGLKFALVYMDNEKEFNKLTDMDFVYAEKPDFVMNYSIFERIPKPVIIAPNNGEKIDGTVQIKTIVWDSDNSIKKIEFYANNTLIGTDSTSPYTLAEWHPADGTYLLTVKVFDNGQTKTSSSKTIIVGTSK
jgi:glycerophosphoryl diester phosphodiesterase